MKFGDGQHNYIDLEYFRTGDVEIVGSLDGQILIYNESSGKWEPKAFADDKSIEYSDDGLQIVGFGPDKQGAGPIVNEGRIIWKQAITDETLDAKVEEAQQAADNAKQFASQTLIDACKAEKAAKKAEQARDATVALLGEKFWFGTRAEYETEVIGQNQLKEGTIYFIRDYDWENFPNQGGN